MPERKLEILEFASKDGGVKIIYCLNGGGKPRGVGLVLPGEHELKNIPENFKVTVMEGFLSIGDREYSSATKLPGELQRGITVIVSAQHPAYFKVSVP
jgi:hypothetical protein